MLCYATRTSAVPPPTSPSLLSPSVGPPASIVRKRRAYGVRGGGGCKKIRLWSRPASEHRAEEARLPAPLLALLDGQTPLQPQQRDVAVADDQCRVEVLLRPQQVAELEVALRAAVERLCAPRLELQREIARLDIAEQSRARRGTYGSRRRPRAISGMRCYAMRAMLCIAPRPPTRTFPAAAAPRRR